MRIPKRLQPLIDEGLVDEVVRPVTSGKEAEVYIVWSGGKLRAAKVYKEADKRSFKNRADYLDGRGSRGTRGERAQKRGGRFAKEQEESAWYEAEVLALEKLSAAGVRVPKPRGFLDGVLLMDLLLDMEGEPAPRLADCDFEEDEARELFGWVIVEVQRMLCAGVVHGDLSEYNILLAVDGPVIIDLPQMVNAAASQVARKLLVRDVANVRAFLGRFAPDLEATRYAEEMWRLWERAALTPDTALTGRFHEARGPVDTRRVQQAIGEAERERERELLRQGGGATGGRRKRRSGGGPGPQAQDAGQARDRGSEEREMTYDLPPQARRERPRDDGPRHPQGPPPRRDDRARNDQRPPQRRDDRPRDERPRNDQRPPPRRDDRPRDERPRNDQRPPPRRDDRPRDERPRNDQRPPQRRDDRPRDERPRNDQRPPPRRDDRPRDERPRNDQRPPPRRGDRPRDERPRNDQRPPPRRDDRPRDERPRNDQRPPRRDERPPPRRDDRPRRDDERPSRDERPQRERQGNG